MCVVFKMSDWKNEMIFCILFFFFYLWCIDDEHVPESLRVVTRVDRVQRLGPREGYTEEMKTGRKEKRRKEKKRQRYIEGRKNEETKKLGHHSKLLVF